MEISGSNGLQVAQAGLTQATIDVAGANSAPQAQQATQTETATAVSQTDTTQAIVSALESEQQGQASARVIEAGSEVLGSIIDLEA